MNTSDKTTLQPPTQLGCELVLRRRQDVLARVFTHMRTGISEALRSLQDPEGAWYLKMISRVAKELS